MNRCDEMPTWLPWAAAVGVLAAYLLVVFDVSMWHPGYAYGDERISMCWLQDLREGRPLTWQFSRGCWTRCLQWLWIRWNGASLQTLHTPELAGLAVEWLALVLLARRWFSDEVAAWSALALAVSAQTWVRARSLLSFQALPMESLMLALAAGRVKGRFSALVWGLAAALLFLDYDGTLIAIPCVWVACVAFEEPFRRQAYFSGLGLAVGGLFIFWMGHADLANYVAARLGGGGVRAADAGLAGRLVFLWQVLVGGAVLPYFGVTHWPAWAPWTWPALSAGIWAMRRGPGRVLVFWAGLGVLATQMVRSSYGLPLHRLVCVAPALALISGVGFVALRKKLGVRSWLLGVLLLAGLATEGWAWCRHQMAFAPELYDRCLGLQEVRDVYSAQLADPTLRVVTQLSGTSEADARFVLDRNLLVGGPKPARVLAVIPADYMPALKSLGVRGDVFWVAKGLEPAVALCAQGDLAAHLSAIQDTLAPLVGAVMDPLAPRKMRIDQWLRAESSGDLWDRTGALEADLETAVRTDGVNAEELSWLFSTKVSCAAPDMVLARATYQTDPRSALVYCRRAELLDPDDGEALLEEAAALRSLGDPRSEAVSRTWIALRAAGSAWRSAE